MSNKRKRLEWAEAHRRLHTTTLPFTFAMTVTGHSHSFNLVASSDDPDIDGMEITLIDKSTPYFVAVVPERFPDYDARKAMEEGWAMFATEGRFQLQRDDDAGIFESDADAVIHVAVCAAQGSKLHREAITMIGQLVDTD